MKHYLDLLGVEEVSHTDLLHPDHLDGGDADGGVGDVIGHLLLQTEKTNGKEENLNEILIEYYLDPGQGT